MERKGLIGIIVVLLVFLLVLIHFLFDPLGLNKTSSQEVETPQQSVTTQPVQPVDTVSAAMNKNSSSKKNMKKKMAGDKDYYIVKEGDTLAKIAEDVYGNSQKWFKIFAANEGDIDWYNNIYPGQKLKLPE